MAGQESRQKFSLGFAGVDLKSEAYKGFSDTGEIIKEDKDTLPVKVGTVQTAFINVKYNYLGTVHTSQNERYKFLLGGGFDYYLISKRFRSINYINSITDNITTFSFYGALNYVPSEKHVFEFSISLPLITFINRTLRLQEGVPDLYEFKKWVTINKMFGFATNLNYNFRFAKRWSLEADYSFLYYQYPLPRKVQLGMHSVTTGLNFHF
jgi:hypothetical protein